MDHSEQSGSPGLTDIIAEHFGPISDDGPQISWAIIRDNQRRPVQVQKTTCFGAVCSIVEATVEDLAKEYVDTIYQPANAWGQCVHPQFGVSHQLMILMCDLFGSLPAQEAISLELARRKP